MAALRSGFSDDSFLIRGLDSMIRAGPGERITENCPETRSEMFVFFTISFGNMSMPEGGEKPESFPGQRKQEVRQMGMTWKETIEELTKEFKTFGCRFSGKKLPELAVGYDCTPLFFWNWMNDPETPRSEKGFLRVLGYAWRKYLQEEAEQEAAEHSETAAAEIPAGKAA